MHVFLLWVLTAIKIWKKAVIWIAVAHARCHELKVLLTFKYAKDTFNKKGRQRVLKLFWQCSDIGDYI